MLYYEQHNRNIFIGLIISNVFQISINLDGHYFKLIILGIQFKDFFSCIIYT